MEATDWNEWRAGLDQLAQLLIDYDAGIEGDQRPLLSSHTPEQVQASFRSGLPAEGEPLAEVISAIASEILPHVNYNPHPRYAAYITGSANKPAALAELAKAFLNQNGLKWNSSPAAAELEQLVIAWIGEFMGIPHRQGFLTSCGSTANYYALHFALARRVPHFQTQGLRQLPPLAIYQSDQAHSSLVRAAYFLGLGTDCVRTVRTQTDHQMDIGELRAMIEADREAGIEPLAIIGNAGSTNTGVVDNLRSLAAIAQAYKAWFHVDGAYGGPVAGVPEFSRLFEGAEHADSVVINPHKWLYVPFEVSTVLLREPPTVYQGTPSYLQDLTATERQDLSTPTIELSKEFRALKVWFTFRYYGADRLRQAIARDVAQIQQVAARFAKSEVLEVVGPHPLSILCFRLRPAPGQLQHQQDAANRAFLQHLQQEGYVFLIGTEIFGAFCLRLCFVSLTRTAEDVERLCDYLEAAAAEI